MTILSARAVADMLGMTRHHLNSMAAAGEIPAAKVAGKWVFIEDQLIGWLRAKQNFGTPGRRQGVPGRRYKGYEVRNSSQG